jgi:Fur family ferric uptake transcriptional regulator
MIKWMVMDAHKRIKSHGYRLTRQRKVVLEVLSDHPGRPLNPADVHRLASEKMPGIGLTTVYRTLELLSELGIVLRVHLHEEAQHYELNTGEHHHHLVCLSCRSILPYRGCDLEELEERVRDESDFLVTSHCLSIFGYCGECLAAARG